MTAPDLFTQFRDAMRDLGDAKSALEQHGPAYLREVLEAQHRGRLHAPARPPELPAVMAKLIRDYADDAIVRDAARNPSAVRHGR